MNLKKLIILFLPIVCVFVLVSCKSASTEPQPPPDTRNFFPVTNGTMYKFSLTQTDTLGNPSNGTRISLINGVTNIDSTEYQIQLDSVFIASSTIVSNSYFRKSTKDDKSTILIAVDTTGLYESIPPEYLQYLTIDEEILAFSFPLTSLVRLCFKLAINIPNFGEFIPVKLESIYTGMENIELQLNSGTVTHNAAKIRLDLTIRRDIAATPQILSANVWLVENIGIVKWDGNLTIVNAFTGGGIDFDDSTRVTTQSITEYYIAE
ncbi:MAG: hypothetical protein IPM56_03870 [Ignavibacteriales bacterium]|nr:MAG: hypothetical protein IPM56_03870 [Ignavibacteriales bacterium]